MPSIRWYCACGICDITGIGGWAVCFRGACIYCAMVHQALAGHVTLTCGHHLLALIFGLMIGVGRACRHGHLSVLVLRQEISRKRRRTDRFFVSSSSPGDFT